MRLDKATQKANEFKTKALPAITAVTAAYVCVMSNMAFADAASQLLELLLGIMATIFIVLGAITGLLGVGSWISAHGEGDGPAQTKAVGKIAAGIGLIIFALVVKGSAGEIVSIITSEI